MLIGPEGLYGTIFIHSVRTSNIMFHSILAY